MQAPRKDLLETPPDAVPAAPLADRLGEEGCDQAEPMRPLDLGAEIVTNRTRKVARTRWQTEKPHVAFFLLVVFFVVGYFVFVYLFEEVSDCAPPLLAVRANTSLL